MMNPTNSSGLRRWYYYLGGVFLFYAVIRLLAWSNTLLLEDTDSIGYLRTIKQVATLDPQAIAGIDAYYTPFYPAFAAFFTLLTGDVETGARLCSYFFSLLLFGAIAGIGLRLASPLGVMLGLLLVACSPILISLSFAVLTEPSFIATVYLGLFLFWIQYKTPGLLKAGLIGAVFALAFLNRIEGLIFLVLIPLFQVLHFIIVRPDNYDMRKLAAWVAVFIVGFSVVSAPQVYRVSEQAGQFTINGRQVWSNLLSIRDGRSFTEKTKSLDLSPSVVNIKYLMRYPEEVDKLRPNNGTVEQSTAFLQDHYKSFIRNVRQLIHYRIPQIVGYAVAFFFIVGIAALVLTRRYFEAVITTLFVGAAIFPAMFIPTLPRHLALSVPLVLLVAGTGIAALAKVLVVGRFPVAPVALGLLLIVPVSFASELWTAVFHPPSVNREYSVGEYKEEVALIKRIARDELGHRPVLMDQRSYLSYFSDSKHVSLPYAEMKPMLRYCELNEVDFVYFNDRRIEKYPFYAMYKEQGLPDNYILLLSGTDATGAETRLYRVVRKN